MHIFDMNKNKIREKEENDEMMKELELICKAARLIIKDKVWRGELDAHMKEDLK